MIKTFGELPQINRAFMAGVSAAALLLAASNAAAQNYSESGSASRPGIYLEVGPSYHEFEGDNGLNADAWGLTGRAGWQFTPMLSVEADATFGISDGSFDYRSGEGALSLDDNSDGDLADVINASGNFGLNYMLGLYGRVSYPVTPQIAIFARAGYVHLDVDSTVATPGGNSFKVADNEDGPSFGAGASWHFTENSAVRADFTYTDFDFAEDNALGLAYQFKF